MRILLLSVFVCVISSGCTITNTNKSLKEENITSSWTVKRPIREVYSTYNSHAQSAFEITALGVSVQANGNYYPSENEAEVWVRLVGEVTFFLLELKAEERGTRVTCYVYKETEWDMCGQFKRLRF